MAKFLLIGDAVQGETYIPHALYHIKRMKQQGLTTGNRTVVPEIGVSIRITLDPIAGDRVYIEAGGGCTKWYMDSGLVNRVAEAPKHKDRGVPGTLYLGDNLKTNRMWGEILVSSRENASAIPQVEGAELGAFTASYPPVPVGDGILPPAPLSPNATQAELQAWVNSATDAQLDAWVLAVNNETVTAWHQSRSGARDSLAIKKRDVRDCPSSLFHGKLRLWVQAIYGKKFAVADWPGKYAFTGKLQPSFRISLPTTENPDRHYVLNSNTTILYTDNQLNYWLIEMYSETSATIRALNLSTCGEVARLYLLTDEGKALNRENKAAFEAVMLQTAVPDMSERFTLPTGIPSASRGVTLCYGWKATWDGDKADIVLHVERQGPTSADADVYFDASHLSLEFHRDTTKGLSEGQTEKDRWMVKGTDRGFKKWMVTVTQHNIWVPDFDETGQGLLRVFPPMECGPSRVAPTPLSSTAPLYCFYDKEDNLQRISYTQTITAGYTYTNTDPCYTTYGMPGVVFSDNSSYASKSGTTGVKTSAEFISPKIGASHLSETKIETANIYGTGANEVWLMAYAPPTGSSRTFVPIGSGWPPGDGAAYFWGDTSYASPANSCMGATQQQGSLAARSRFICARLNTESYNNLSINYIGRVTLVVPYGDSCAMYIGEEKEETSAGARAYSENWGITQQDWSNGSYPTDTLVASVKINPFQYSGIFPISSSAATNVTGGATYKYTFSGFSGTHDADPTFFHKSNDNPSGAMFDPGTIMAPVRFKPTNTSALQFYTISSAVYGDTIGKTFTTGGYTIPAGDSILKGFIGFV